MGSRGRCRGDRGGRDRPAGRHRRAGGRRVGHRGRGGTDIGGHAITSGGNVPLGGGTSAQKQYGIEDLPDLLFRDLTDWSVVEPNGFPDYRYNDREIIRAFADNSAATFEWLVAHGVIFVDKAPDALGGNSVGNSVPREMHCRGDGLADGADRQAGRSGGARTTRPRATA